MIPLISIVYLILFMQRVFASPSLSERSSPPPGWTPYLCLEDNRDNLKLPLLTGAHYADPVGMTIEKCSAFCDSQPVSYRFMGLTDGFQCSCDNFFEHIFENVGDSSCNAPCRGDQSETSGCGGSYTASTYTKDSSTFIIPALVPSVGLWQGLGCYNDSTSARALQVRVNAGKTTVESCVAACHNRGFFLAGVENGGECWCGSELQHSSQFTTNDNGIQYDHFRPFPDAASCNMACEGDPTETCGGPALLDLYNFTGTH